MQPVKKSKYNVGEYYLIKDSNYKSDQFIGKIKVIGSDEVTLNIYIFPADTKEGRKDHNGQFEVFATDDEMRYKFSGKEYKVEVTSLADYVNRKYVQKDCFGPLYFQRQKYINNNLEPPLTKTCYCQKIFNPDDAFKICDCGTYFHTSCFLNTEEKKCSNPNCNKDCSSFFNNEEIIEKNKNIKKKKGESEKKTSFEIDEKQFNKSQNINLSESEDINLSSNKNNEKKPSFTIKKENTPIKIDKFLSIKRENNQIPIISLAPPPKNSQKLFEVKQNTSQSTIKVEKSLTEEEKTKKTESTREQCRKLILENILKGIQNLQENQSILDNLTNEKPTLLNQINLIKENNDLLIQSHYKNIAKLIEESLFKFSNSKTESYYIDFLQEFAKLKYDNMKLLHKIILGEYTPEEIGKFHGEDFLSDEKKKKRQELKHKEFENMLIKENNEIRLVSNKGRMLTEIQKYHDVNKVGNYSGIEIQNNPIRLSVVEKEILDDGKKNPRFEYYQKLKNMSEKYPNLSENNLKLLIDLKEPDENYIQNKLNSAIQNALDLEEQHKFFEFRNSELRKKADVYFITNTGRNGEEKDVQDYIKKISFDIKF